MQKTTFNVEKMDCPSEERLVRLKLEGRSDVESLAFDLGQRRLEVVHSGDPAHIARELESLALGSSMIGSTPAGVEVMPGVAPADERRLLWQVLLINLLFFVLEMVAGALARSMGLVADSLDMLADSTVYALSLYAVGRTARHKGGVAATAGVLQLVLALLGLVETIRRFVTPQPAPDFKTMIGISLLALAGNAACLYLLQKSRTREAHMQASLIFTSNDVIANVGVVVAGILVLVTASKWPDLVAGVVIFLLVGRGAVRILSLSRDSRAAAIMVLSIGVVALPAVAIDPRDPTESLTQYRIDGWKSEQGLPLDTVQVLLQTGDGYLWVGTGGGLARFDGIRFATFEASGMPQLAALPVFGLMEDADGNLWVGHADGAAIYSDGTFRTAFGREVTNGRRVWSFAQAPDGAIWAATENGLVHWRDGVIRVYHVADGLPVERLRSVAFDRHGTLWIGSTGGGLVSFEGGRFRTFTPENGFPHLAVRSVLADPAGGVWAATAGGGLAHMQRETIRTYTTADGLPTDQLTSLTRDARGSLWIGTWGSGIVRLRDGTFTSLSTDGDLAGDQIWSIHADREGSIWVGTWVGGLNRVRPRDFVVLGTPEGLAHDNVRAVLHARDGSTWITTAGAGLNRIHDGTITWVQKKDGLPSDEASTLLEDRDGTIWVGTYTNGVARLRDGKIESFGARSGLPSLDVRALFQDRSGTLWVSTTSGLARFDGSRFLAVREPGAPSQGASAMMEDRSGTLWIGSDEGLLRYRNGVFSRLTRDDGLVSNWILSLYEDADGAIWVGSNGEGLNRLKDGRISAIRPADGLWDGLVQVMLEDGRGNLWMTCNRGFFRVARAELNAFADGRITKITSVGYGPGDALRSTTFAGGLQPAGAVGPQGRLWLPSFRGLVIVDPAHLPDSGEPPVVHFEEITVDGSPVAGREIVLPPGSRPLSIRYTTGSLRAAERVRFRYRMEGATDEWVEVGTRREAFFPKLPHGEYRFRVAASTDGKRWREAAAPLVLKVRPHFFQTPWFLVLVAVAVVAGIAGLLRLRTSQLQRRQAEMERLVNEKTEELRLANERLERLSFVDSLTGLANRRKFDEALEEEWRRARRSSTPLALIVADVDLFKDYNDTLGHPEGDRCLVAVAEVFRSAARRAGEIVARVGGEEFVVLIHADEPGALAFAEKLREACEARAIPHPASPVAPVVTISLGVAVRIPDDAASADVLVVDADAALYSAKRAGRNRVWSSANDET